MADVLAFRRPVSADAGLEPACPLDPIPALAELHTAEAVELREVLRQMAPLLEDLLRELHIQQL